ANGLRPLVLGCTLHSLPAAPFRLRARSTDGTEAMATRIDSASRRIAAPPETVYRAFAEPGAMERWLSPGGMTARMLHFDFREGGSYRMRLTYADPGQGHGKASADSDEVDVRLTKLAEGRSIEQEVTFRSDDPAFSGVMRMTW